MLFSKFLVKLQSLFSAFDATIMLITYAVFNDRTATDFWMVYKSRAIFGADF